MYSSWDSQQTGTTNSHFRQFVTFYVTHRRVADITFSFNQWCIFGWQSKGSVDFLGYILVIQRKSRVITGECFSCIICKHKCVHAAFLRCVNRLTQLEYWVRFVSLARKLILLLSCYTVPLTVLLVVTSILMCWSMGIVVAVRNSFLYTLSRSPTHARTLYYVMRIRC